MARQLCCWLSLVGLRKCPSDCGAARLLPGGAWSPVRNLGPLGGELVMRGPEHRVWSTSLRAANGPDWGQRAQHDRPDGARCPRTRLVVQAGRPHPLLPTGGAMGAECRGRVPPAHGGTQRDGGL